MIFGWKHLVQHLEAELLKQEQHLKNICAEKERQIVWLRQEVERLRAHNDRLELKLEPKPKEATKPKAPDVPIEDERDWHNYLNRYMREGEKNVSDKERQGVHQQASNDAPPADGGQPAPAGTPGKLPA